MKKTMKIFLLQCVLGMAFAVLFPMTASAEVTYEKNQVFYMDSKNVELLSTAEITIKRTEKTEKIKNSSVKISNPQIAELRAIIKNKNTMQYKNYYVGEESITQNEYRDSILLLLKKPGKTKVAFQMGEKTCTVNVIVKKYTNPIKKLTISGVNQGKNIAYKLNDGNTSDDLTISKKTKRAELYVVAKKNWKIETVMIADEKKQENYSYGIEKNGKTRVRIVAGTLQPKRKYMVNIKLRHKNGGVINCQYRINYAPVL